MELSPKMYHWFVRPKWFTNKYNGTLKSLWGDFNFENKRVLDFGCGIGSSSCIFNPKDYIGIDCDDRRISYARRLYPSYKFELLKENKMSFLDESIDYILIMAVLHHISSSELSKYLKEFKRLLRADGKIIVMEPCFFERFHFSNWYMKSFDKGKYIRRKDEYFKIFHENNFKTNNVKRFKKWFYNEIFFTANLDN